MTRNLVFLLFFLSSCAYVQYQNLPSVASKLIFGAENFIVDKNFYDSQPFSFAKVEVGRSGVSIFVLSKINSNDEFIWVSADNERLITKNGRIIALYSDRQFSFNYLNRGVFDNFPMENTREYLLQLEYPDAIFEQVASIEVLSHSEAVSRFDGFINTKLFIEEIKTQKLKWNYVNKYWQDNSNRVIKSTQTLHPNLQRISVNYYYKY